jgi:hypothetical protein
MLEQILFSATFVFGVLSLLTRTKLFDTTLGGLLDTLYWRKLPPVFQWIDVILFLLCLGYQANYWLYN